MTDAEYIRYQQILPFYFYLGDYTKLPKTRMELRTCMYSLLSGTLIFGDKSWQGVYYDISKARFVFRNMVIHADELFSLDKTRLQKQVNWLTFTVFKNNGDDEQIRHDVGNWLAFGAYITLLSKYQRYALNAEGFKDAKSFVGAEVTNYYRKLRERIG